MSTLNNNPDLYKLDVQDKNPEALGIISTLQDQMKEISACMPVFESLKDTKKNCIELLYGAKPNLDKLKGLVDKMSDKDKALYEDDFNRLNSIYNQLVTSVTKLIDINKAPFTPMIPDQNMFAELEISDYLWDQEASLLLHNFGSDINWWMKVFDSIIWSAVTDKSTFKSTDKSAYKSWMKEIKTNHKRLKDEKKFTSEINKFLQTQSGDSLEEIKYNITKSREANNLNFLDVKYKDRINVRLDLYISLLTAQQKKIANKAPVLVSVDYLEKAYKFDESIWSISRKQEQLLGVINEIATTETTIAKMEDSIVSTETDIARIQTALQWSNTPESTTKLTIELEGKQKTLIVLEWRDTAWNIVTFDSDDDGNIIPAWYEKSKPYLEYKVKMLDEQKKDLSTAFNELFKNTNQDWLISIMTGMTVAFNDSLKAYFEGNLKPLLESQISTINETKQTSTNEKTRISNEIDSINKSHKEKVNIAISSKTPIPSFDNIKVVELSKSWDMQHTAEVDSQNALFNTRKDGIKMEYTSLSTQIARISSQIVELWKWFNNAEGLDRFFQVQTWWEKPSLLTQSHTLADEFKETVKQRNAKTSPEQIDELDSLNVEVGQFWEKQLVLSDNIDATKDIMIMLLDHYKLLLYRQTKCFHEMEKVNAEQQKFNSEKDFEFWSRKNAFDSTEQSGSYVAVEAMDKNIEELEKENKNLANKYQKNGIWKEKSEVIPDEYEALANAKEKFPKNIRAISTFKEERKNHLWVLQWVTDRMNKNLNGLILSQAKSLESKYIYSKVEAQGKVIEKFESDPNTNNLIFWTQHTDNLEKSNPTYKTVSKELNSWVVEFKSYIPSAVSIYDSLPKS
jgi:hypothetical protein